MSNPILPYDFESTEKAPALEVRVTTERKSKLSSTVLKSPTWTERNLLYAGDVVAFSPPTDQPKNIPANELTYLSQGLAINSQRGVFANRSFDVG